jgi:methyltransferase family protein
MLGDLPTVLAAIKPTDRVLDVGGGMQPLLRADVVIDIMPFEERGSHGSMGEGKPNFTKDSWIVADFSNHERFPFSDKEFDFVFCSHTLEDIADPFWVCREMQRVGKRGYIETPPREAESTRGIAGKWKINKQYFAGYYHHRWFSSNTDLTGQY